MFNVGFILKNICKTLSGESKIVNLAALDEWKTAKLLEELYVY
jgi:hypothetical protein